MRSPSQELTQENVQKIKNTYWNKIIHPKEFESFNKMKYFRWVEYYRKNNKDLIHIAPKEIEQKLAIIEIFNSLDTKSTKSHKILEDSLNKYLTDDELNLKNIQLFVVDFSFILKSPPPQILQYFIASKETFSSEQFYNFAVKDFLYMGASEIFRRVMKIENLSISLTDLDAIAKNYFTQDNWKSLLNQNEHYWLKRANIPSELIKDTYLKGFNNNKNKLHQHFADNAFQGQMPQFENIFKNVYLGVTLSILKNHYLNNSQDGSIPKRNPASVSPSTFFENYIKFFRFQTETDAKNTADSNIRYIQLERSLKDFKDKFKEIPNQQEYSYIYDKIFKSEPILR